MWIASLAAWVFVGLFVIARDILIIGPQAPGLHREELVPFVQSILLWGVLTPFIIAITQRLSLERGARLRSLVAHALWAFAICIGDILFDALFSAVVGVYEQPLARLFYEQVFINHFSYAAVAAAGYAVIYGRQLAANRTRSAELERRLAQAKLEALTRKLQPHFLFNSLNSIAALIRLADNAQALAALVALSDLLRVVLSTDGDARVPLEQELEWVERYLRIERMRFDNRLRTEVHFDPVLAGALVPALVLQPFVENAIRHGVEQRSGCGLVSIAAAREGDYLSLVVHDSSDLPASGTQRPGFGLGLESTRERLAHLYGEERFALSIDSSMNETRATLRIPYLVAAS